MPEYLNPKTDVLANDFGLNIGHLLFFFIGFELGFWLSKKTNDCVGLWLEGDL